MASIQPQIEKIGNAIYGEEVRTAICEGLQKINDDNNFYNSLKDEIFSKSQEINQTLEELEKNLNEVEPSIDELKRISELMNQLNVDIENKISTIDQLKSAIDEASIEIEQSLNQLKNENSTALQNIDSLENAANLINEMTILKNLLETLIKNESVIDLTELNYRMTELEKDRDTINEIFSKVI